MIVPVPVLVVLGVILSAHARLNAVIAGHAVSVQPLLLVFAVVMLGLAVVLLAVVHAIVRDGLRLFPAMSGA